MGNCTSSSYGENYESDNIKEHNNKRSIKSFFQNENEKIESKAFIIKGKDIPIKLNNDKLRLEPFIDENTNNITKSSKAILDTNDSYEKNHIDIFSFRKAQSFQVTHNNTEANPYDKYDTIIKVFDYKNNIRNNILKNKSIDINILDKCPILINKESCDNYNQDFDDSKRSVFSLFIVKDEFLGKKSEKITPLKNNENEALNNKIEESFEENKIVEEIRQNKIFYNSDGLKSFRRKTPKSTINHRNQEEKSKNFFLQFKFHLRI
jgi:hypothetical protein